MERLPACFPQEHTLQEPMTKGIWWSERHLQCIWMDAHLRPALYTTGGLPVEVLDPGTRNGSAGPDFIGALIRIGDACVRGDVEVHIHPGDWFAHRHESDPNYSSVVLHVCWEPPRPGETVPEIPLVPLRDAMLARPRFSFDQIDPDAYPWNTGTQADRPCFQAFANRPSAEVIELLETAGRRRLLRKSEELSHRILRAGSLEQGFYAEILAGLGFHANATPMRALAGAVPLEELCERCDPLQRYALLMAAAGLLPHDPAPAVPEEYLRELWNASFLAGAMEAPDAARRWKLSGIRPVNAPRIRLAVAASLFSTPGNLLSKLENVPREKPSVWVKDCEKIFLEGAQEAGCLLPLVSGKTRSGLLGKNRIHALLINAVIPIFLREDANVWKLASAIPGEDLGVSMKEMARRLFGADYNPAIYTKTALRMQGLLEIWKGYCTASALACQSCLLARHTIK